MQTTGKVKKARLAHQRDGCSKEERTDKKEMPSFYELTKDLCGSISAPSDLSSNKQRLNGYGK
jgi:hypothetical protein